MTTRPVRMQEPLEGSPARTEFGRTLQELGIAWMAAHSPQAKGRIERLFGTLQDRLVKEMRLAGIDTSEGPIVFWRSPFGRSGTNALP